MSDFLQSIPLEEYSVEDRVALLERVWDSLLHSEQPPPMPSWHKEEIASRIANSDANPGRGIPLEQLRRELLGEKS